MSAIDLESFAPIKREYTLTDLDVSGTIPEFLDGRYLRNGPNPIAEVDPATYHFFVGDGMVHGIRLREGRAEWYRNRWVRNPRASKALGEPAGRRRQVRAGYEVIGANTSVIGHAGKTLALVEGGNASYELTDELDTVGPCDFDGTLPGGYTAHPLRDPHTGDLHAVSYFFGRGNTVQYSIIAPDGRARRVTDIEVMGSPMMHSFSLTDQHVVLYDLPVTFDAAQAAELTTPQPLRWASKLALSSLIGRVRIPDPISARLAGTAPANGGYPYRWDPAYPARIGIMPRDGGAGDVRWFEVEPCYVFHPLNAYDDGETVVLDVARYDKMFDRDLHGLETPPRLHRWTIDCSTGKVGGEYLHERPQEFPRIDERLTGKQHRYGYTANPDEGTVYKHDMVRGGTATRSFGPGTSVGEFIFHPTAPDAAEDDGILMGLVYDATTDRSDLTLLNAETLDTIGAVHLPHRVPAGFHGNWVPTND